MMKQGKYHLNLDAIPGTWFPHHSLHHDTRCLFAGVFCFREETDKEVNVKARLPAWAKGKSVVLDMTKTSINLSLKEEEGTPIIEVCTQFFLAKGVDYVIVAALTCHRAAVEAITAEKVVCHERRDHTNRRCLFDWSALALPLDRPPYLNSAAYSFVARRVTCEELFRWTAAIGRWVRAERD